MEYRLILAEGPKWADFWLTVETNMKKESNVKPVLGLSVNISYHIYE